MSSRERKIGILTGGGDVPGLNPCIKAVVINAERKGYRVIGVKRGWGGLLSYNPDQEESYAENIEPLTSASVRTIDRYGGTHLHTSRTNPGFVRSSDLPVFLSDQYQFLEGQKTVDCTSHVLRNIEKLGIDVLVPIGGDDTLSYAARLHQEGVPMVTIPKTMDNDVFGTDYCIGFGTAVSRSVDFIDDLRTPTGSHERIAVIELFGRNSGETALFAGWLTGERTIIPEVPFDVEKLAELLMMDREQNPSNYSMVAISEGASMVGGQVVEYGQEDAYGHRKLGGIGLITSEAIKKITGVDTVSQSLAYLMRSGKPELLDRVAPLAFGDLAVRRISEGRTGLMVASVDGNYETVPVETPTQGVKRVDVAEYYDINEYRPKIKNMLNKPMFLT